MIGVTRVNSVEDLVKLEADGKLVGLFDVPNEIYHAGPGLSSSDLKEILRSPAHFKVYKESEKKETPAMVLGTLIHLAVLEPGLFADSVVVARKFGRTKAEQEEKAAFLTANEGKRIVDEDDMAMIKSLAQTIRSNPLASKVIGGKLTEISVYWRDEETGILCKARADNINGDLITDLKSCGDAGKQAFEGVSRSLGYHISAAYYLDGFATALPDVRLFAWLAVEKTAPYGCRFYVADQETLQAGRLQYREALDTYARCEKSGVWPGYEMKFETITIA